MSAFPEEYFDVDGYEGDPLETFVFLLNDAKMCHVMLDWNPDLYATGRRINHDSQTLLMAAAAAAATEVVSLLIYYGADVDAKDDNGDTALHYANRLTDPDKKIAIQALLVEGGASTNIVNRNGRIALDTVAVRTIDDVLLMNSPWPADIVEGSMWRTNGYRRPGDDISVFAPRSQRARNGESTDDYLAQMMDNLSQNSRLSRGGTTAGSRGDAGSARPSPECAHVETAVAVPQRSMSDAELGVALEGAVLEHFHVIKKIGASAKNLNGQYGVCSAVYHVNFQNNDLAIKCILDPQQANSTRSIMNRSEREAKLPCPPNDSVIPILYHFIDDIHTSAMPGWPAGEFYRPLREGGEGNDRTLFVVMPLFQRALKPAARERRENRRFYDKWCLTVLCGMLRGVRHLVEHHVLHMDMKLDNVLIDNETDLSCDLILADFGCAIQVNDPSITRVPRIAVWNREGNPFHRAPELYGSNLASVIDASKAEVWSIGLMMHEILHGDNTPDVRGTPYPSEDTLYLQTPIETSYVHDLACLVGKMLAEKPADRISAADACCLAHALLFGMPHPSNPRGFAAGDRAVIEAWRSLSRRVDLPYEASQQVRRARAAFFAGYDSDPAHLMALYNTWLV